LDFHPHAIGILAILYEQVLIFGANMQITQEQQDFYQSARERCRQDVYDINRTIRGEWEHLNSEVERVKVLIETLETRKQSIAQIYASASDMLGLENDLDTSPAIHQEGEMTEEIGEMES